MRADDIIRDPRRQAVASAFGRALIRARRHSKLSQMALARKSGVHNSYIELLEHGRRAPSVLMLTQLAPALQLSEQQLFARFVEEWESP